MKKVAFTELHPLVLKYKNIVPLYHDAPRSLESFDIPQGQILLFTSVGDYAYFNDYIPAFDRCLDYYNSTGKLLNFYIILTQQNIPENLSKKYEPVAKFYRIPSFYAWYRNKLDFDKFFSNKQISKIFLSLNNRAMWYRQALFYLFVKNNLLEKSIFSYRATDTFNEGNQFDKTHGRVPNILEILDQDISEIKKIVPYTIPNDNIKLTGSWKFDHDYFYNTTFCSVITETYLEQGDPFFTEKVFKPIAFGHPFLLCASDQSLFLLKELGFETFPEIFDESYDQEKDVRLRLKKLFEEILRISKWSINDCNIALDRVDDKLKHNVNHFANILPSIYKRDIETLMYQLDILIAKKQPLIG